ncbi:MAG: fructose-phosphate kinase [Lachnospiraceae bacterium]|jgi:1-phosphofructokinase|nr:fructose-phosphate kinase [Lachnospiraceae bacterium]
MIYTVTFNPSLDYIVQVNEFKKGIVNRTESEEILPGGKGINVSFVLKNLGIKSIALGFVAGFTGKEIESSLKVHGCVTDFIRVEQGMSRINIKLKSDVETEINGQGPNISESDLEKMFKKLEELQDGDILVLAGSISNRLPQNIYEDILERLAHKNVRVVVDATKDLLMNVLKYHPFLIKPNNHELGEMFGVTLSTKDEVIFYAKKLKEMGAVNVLISMAGEGAILVCEDGKVYDSPAPKGKVVNSVGAGDSMVAGFITGYLENGSYYEAFKMGLATGSASAFSPKLATKQEVLELLKTI